MTVRRRSLTSKAIMACGVSLALVTACTGAASDPETPGDQGGDQAGDQGGDHTAAVAAPAGVAMLFDRDGVVLGWLTPEGDRSAAEQWASDAVTLISAEARSSSSIRAARESAPQAEIRTTIDADLQAALQAAIDDVPSTGGRFAVAAVAVDVASGEVLAVADSAPASTLASLPRPTGSVMKFVVALAAVSA